MSVSDDLCRAVEGMRVALLEYDGDEEPVRTVHPHGVFISTQDSLSVETYQVGGYTTSPALPHWRTFKLAKVVTVHVLDDEFPVAPGWNPSAAKYSNGFIAHVKADEPGAAGPS